MRTRFLVQIGLALMIASMAVVAQAEPIISISPESVGPIGCTDSATFVFNYDPNGFEVAGGAPIVVGFEVVMENDAGEIIVFDETDVTNIGWPEDPWFFSNNVGGQIKVGGAILNGDPIVDQTDLFSIVVHGNNLTGLGGLHVVDMTLTRQGNINVDLEPWADPIATIQIDCTPPDAPVMVGEPEYTAGTENTVNWGTVPDAVEYNVVCSNGVSSGWQAGTVFTFVDLVHNTLYTYEVQARDDIGNEGLFSDPVSSTQDAVTPESAVGSLDPAYGTLSFDIPWTASDDMSGVAYVQLRYSHDEGVTWDDFELTHTVSPIIFVAPEDGEYLLYTIATDNAGNAEANPEGDMVPTIVDTTEPDPPVMLAEPDFTPGSTNTVYWEAVEGATHYLATCSNGDNSGWIEGLEWTFEFLTDGETYTYVVRAKDALDNLGDNSDPAEVSTQDAQVPFVEIVDPPSGNGSNLTFDITVDSHDYGGSGVVLVRLFYKVDLATWVQFGDGFVDPVISFIAPVDGAYGFYTIAEDEVGNESVAPAEPELELLVDTNGPSGTFAVNEGADYTTSVDVTLNSAYTDANGVVSMRFRNAGGAWGAWEDYAETFPWVLDLGEGEATVEAEYEDGTGRTTETIDSIILDTIVPLLVTLPWGDGLVAGHQAVTLNWLEDEADTDVSTVEIWVALWDDLPDDVGVSTYPEFDDMYWAPGTDTPPTVESLTLDPDYSLLTEVPAGTMTYVHAEEDRGAYSYYLFAKDHAGNYSAPHSQWARRQVNYILGDFTEDGEIGIGPDVSPFANAYGTREVLGEPEEGYDGVYDIGPVSGGVPTTDNEIGYEDLMVLAANFQTQSDSKSSVGDSEKPVLTWYQVDELNWVMGLVDPCNSLKGLRVSHALPENATVQYSLGTAIKGSSSYFLANNQRNGLDLGFAVLGQNAVFSGSGEILRVTTSEVLDLTNVIVQVRDANNEAIEFDLKAEPLVVLPSVYSLNANYPNPFNPQTTIKFALPEAQDVRLEIFNIKGQRVRVLMDESASAGVHSVIWNGRDGNGRTVASGTYFYRIQAGPLNDTQRMLLIK